MTSSWEGREESLKQDEDGIKKKDENEMVCGSHFSPKGKIVVFLENVYECRRNCP